jgi:hypothetical protein
MCASIPPPPTSQNNTHALTPRNAALVPPPLLPRPPPPLQPGLGRGDEPLRRARGIAPPSARAHVLEHVLPFELDVIHARVRYWAGDAHGYADALGALLRRCRRRARGARVDADRHMWIERGARVGLIAASHFIEIKVRNKKPFFPFFFVFPI